MSQYSARRLRFEDDAETRASRLREAFEGVGRWTHFAALDPGDIRLRRLHAVRELGLRQPRRRTRVDQWPREVELFTEQPVAKGA